MGKCVKATKKVLKGIANAVTPQLVELTVKIVRSLEDKKIDKAEKREIAALAVSALAETLLGRILPGRLVNLLIEFALNAIRDPDVDENDLGLEDPGLLPELELESPEI